MVRINLIGAEKREPKKEFGGRLLTSAVSLGALAFVGGCDTVNNNYYGPDGSTVSDASVCSTISITDRCEGVSSGTSSCPLYEGMAAEMGGVIFKAVNIREEGGVKKLNIEVSDRELDCTTVMTVVLAEMEGPGPVIAVGSKVFVVEVESISIDASNPSANWARLLITDQAREDYVCGDTPVSGRCSGDGANSVRCEVAEESGLEIDGMLFKVLDIEDENVQLSIHDKLLGCLGNGTKNIAYPASESYVIGSYVYTVTIFGANMEDYTVDMQVERRALLCGGAETRGVINVGEFIDSGAGIKVRLDDIMRETGEDNHHDAILTILDMSDNELMQITVGVEDARLISYGGRDIIVSVNEVAPGVMLIAKWADVSVQVCE